MKFEKIADIYKANNDIRAKLINIVSNLDEEKANLSSPNGGWTVANIVEHLSKVEYGMMKISSKLLSKAESEGKTSDGTAGLSENFIKQITQLEGKKFEAPEVVRPENNQTIAESLKVLEQTRKGINDLREKFETVEGTQFTFPHPAFGELNAHDWLTLIGGHEFRHITQIEGILSSQNET